MGDFNNILMEMDKFGGLPANQSRISDFRTCLDDCHLLNLGFEGPKHTWRNHRDSNNIIFQRIDLVLGNVEW